MRIVKRGNEEVARNAEKYLDKGNKSFGQYSALNNNCEHFASKCSTGRARSL